eukprot:1125882-Amphidinium_carterae.1
MTGRAFQSCCLARTWGGAASSRKPQAPEKVGAGPSPCHTYVLRPHNSPLQGCACIAGPARGVRGEWAQPTQTEARLLRIEPAQTHAFDRDNRVLLEHDLG